MESVYVLNIIPLCLTQLIHVGFMVNAHSVYVLNILPLCITQFIHVHEGFFVNRHRSL